MSVQSLIQIALTIEAKKPPLNYASIDPTKNPEGFEQYILAIHAGVSENYEPIKNIFKMLLEQSS